MNFYAGMTLPGWYCPATAIGKDFCEMRHEKGEHIPDADRDDLFAELGFQLRRSWSATPRKTMPTTGMLHLSRP